MKFGFITILILSIGLSACQPKKSSSNQLGYADVDGEQIPIIRLDMVDDSASTIPLSALFEEVKIIPLETKPECLVASFIYTMTDHSVLIAALNSMSPVRLMEFDLNGNWVL